MTATADGFRPGARRGLDACASPRGIFGVLALDHRQNLRRELRPDDPGAVTDGEMVDFKRAVVRALAPVATGTLLDPEVGAAQCIADGSLPGGTGLIVAIEATGYEGPSTARISRVLDGWSVAKAKRMGASAAKLLVYYHPDAANAADQEALVARVAAECRAVDLALFLEPLSFSLVEGARLEGEARRRVVIETARRLSAIGGDILKAEFPFDPSVADRGRWREACAELDEASAVPWVLLSGGVDEATFLAQVEIACMTGASGVVAGRSVWAEAATLPADPRVAFLASTATDRLGRLVDLVEDVGRPWTARATALSTALSGDATPGEGWYREYGS
jgi:tagatose 1,6-diphosphate aldolase